MANGDDRGRTGVLRRQRDGQDSAGSTVILDNRVKPTDEWVTGKEGPTTAQESHYRTLARAAGETPMPLSAFNKGQLRNEISRLRRENGLPENV